jgi:hypothetical protein
MILQRLNMKKKKTRLYTGLALLFMALVLTAPGVSTSAPPEEYQIKAVFIYNMSRFIQWPERSLEDTDDQFTIYIIGEDRFGDAFDSLIGKTVHDRKLVVRRIEPWEDVPVDCRILFVGVSDTQEMMRILDKIEGKALLTISDALDFAQSGGMVELLTIEDRLRFRINSEATNFSGLMVSSKLMSLAVNGDQ